MKQSILGSLFTFLTSNQVDKIGAYRAADFFKTKYFLCDF